MFKAGESGGGSDLVLYLISTYELADVPVDATSRARLLRILAVVKPEEPNLKKIAKEITAWTSKHGSGMPLGDPELHHVLGVKFVAADEAYEAEKHLLVGTKDSPTVLAQLLYEWYSESEDPRQAPLFLSRGVFGYLSLENIRDALEVTKKYVSLLQASGSFTLESATDGIVIFDDLPLLNFLQLLIPTCQYRSAEMYRKLQSRYASDISDIDAWAPALAQLAQQYFGIAPPRSNNMLQDLMSSFMMPPSGGNRALGA